LRHAGRRTGVLGTLSGPRTTPEAPVMQAQLAAFRDDGCDAVAMEVSSMALDQHRADAIDFRIGVWTNLSQDHLDYHGDIESYYRAKARLFDPSRCAAAVVNGDDAAGRRLIGELRIPVTTYGLADAENLIIEPAGSSFTWRGHDVALPLGGAHNVSNALAAATAAAHLGVDPATIAAGLSAAPSVPGRWEVIDAGQPFTVIVDYAHTPDGLEQVLSAARAAVAPGSRVVVVFGCGGDRDRAKRPLMAAAAARLADLAVVTSDNPRSEDPMAIIAEAVAGAPAAGNLVVEKDRESAIRMALRDAAAGDLVVIAGKGHETGQTVGDQTLPFDDRDVARRLLGEDDRRW
jgi:UDP-N-acetylmuramoyl-L-alanyl-D-glutamate--2,6-diaminopimelate ligase